jgi:ABC-type nitrate/sulfonate/bicarbonate transport system permease component
MKQHLAPVGRRLVPWIVPVLLLALWEYAGRHSDSIYLPPLSEVLRTLREDWMWDRTRTDLLPSLQRFALGYLIGAVLGILLGLAIGSSARVAEYTTPTMEFLRALPAVAVLPIAVLLFGLGDGMRISIIAFGVLFPVLVNTIAGARSARQERIDVARMYGLSRFQVIRRVVLPSAIPMISAGLRVGLPIALIMMVVSELVGGQNGIGFYLTQAQSMFDIPGMFTALLILGVVGNVVNSVYAWIETRRLHWASHL